MSHRPTNRDSEADPRDPLDPSLDDVDASAAAAEANEVRRRPTRSRRSDVAEHQVPAVLPFVSDESAGEPAAPSADFFDESGDESAEDLGDEVSDDEAIAELLRSAARRQPDPAEGEADTSAQTLPLPRLRSVLESLLFVADKPLTVQRLLEILEEQAQEPSGRQGPPLYQPSQLQDALQSLADSYLRDQRGIELHQVAGGWQLRTAASNAAWVQRQLQQKPQRLSRAQLETMTIVAYRQPITRPEIDDVRGVDSGGALKTLLERRLVRILGKKEEPGRPLLYGTTREFLEFFNLRDLKDLPTLREYYELNDENKARVRAAHPDAMLPLGSDAGLRDGQGSDGPQQISLPQAAGQAPPAPPVPPLPGLMPEPTASQPASPPPLSRVEILDQQLADDAEQLAKIDELIASVKGETPPIDVLLGMAEAAAMADSQAATRTDADEEDPDGEVDDDGESDEQDSAADDDARQAAHDEADADSLPSAPGQAADSTAVNSAGSPARRGRKKAQEL